MGAAVDLLPTVARAIGAPLPDGRTLDGRDLLPVLAGADRTGRAEFLYLNGISLEAARDGRWKLRLNPQAGGKMAVELYDLVNDPGERWDVAAEQPDIVRRLSERMLAYSRETGAKLPEGVMERK
jgi:arylsulfatase A-like enzyme